MESEGELTAQIAKGKNADEIAKIAKELNVARLYLAKRLLEKAEHEGTNLPR
jgi:glycerate kinase